MQAGRRRPARRAATEPPQEPHGCAPALLPPCRLALRANPFPEVTDLFCRLPLSTLFYRLEAVHLGDLMRLSVRPGVRIGLGRGFSRAIRRVHGRGRGRALPAVYEHLRLNRFRSNKPLTSKDNAGRASVWRLPTPHASPQYPRHRPRNINLVPFR